LGLRPTKTVRQASQTQRALATSGWAPEGPVSSAWGKGRENAGGRLGAKDVSMQGAVASVTEGLEDQRAAAMILLSFALIVASCHGSISGREL
jgi:hypothetical protein